MVRNPYIIKLKRQWIKIKGQKLTKVRLNQRINWTKDKKYRIHEKINLRY